MNDINANAAQSPEIELINGRISALRQEMQEALAQLGDAYARKYSMSFDPEFTPIFNKIFAAQSGIDSAFAEIRAIKGLTLCASCKAEYPKNYPACPRCGLSNPSYLPPAPKKRFCQNCGKEAQPGNNFCTNCGTRY